MRGYVDAKMTAYLNWPLLAALYPNLPYGTDGMSNAPQPWSGSYRIGASTWATAQVTQFAQPGWRFVDAGSGYLGGTESNGSYVTLKSNSTSDYSTVIETTTATAAQTVDVAVRNGLSAGTVHVWSTAVDNPSPATAMVHAQDITPSGGSYSLTVQPGYIYTLTTTTSGQGKGAATGPAPAPLPLRYNDNFDGYATATEARYFSDMPGAYEIRPCAAGHNGQCLQQVAPVKPIEWQDDSDAYGLIGDTGWSNYTVSVDVDLQQSGTVTVLGRAGTQNRPQSHQAAYELRIGDNGGWSIAKTTSAGVLTTLRSGSHPALGLGTWHRLGLGFSGNQITATVDGSTIGTVSDTSYPSGQAGPGVVGYQTDMFDNLSVTASPAGDLGGVLKGLQSGRCVDSPSTTAGAWRPPARARPTAPASTSATAPARPTSSGRSARTARSWGSGRASASTPPRTARPTAPRWSSGPATAARTSTGPGADRAGRGPHLRSLANTLTTSWLSRWWSWPPPWPSSSMLRVRFRWISENDTPGGRRSSRR